MNCIDCGAPVAGDGARCADCQAKEAATTSTPGEEAAAVLAPIETAAVVAAVPALAPAAPILAPIADKATAAAIDFILSRLTDFEAMHQRHDNGIRTLAEEWLGFERRVKRTNPADHAAYFHD